MKITDEALGAAIDVLMDDGHNGIQCRPDRNLAVSTRAALEAALPHLEGATPVVDREALGNVLLAHNIECTGPGEVTCRGCRDKHWMSWTEYRRHVADAIMALIGGAQ